ncbi:MAG: hypothetical protein IAB19_04575 [Proteobacteria bacterium]|uniref:Uncharacterized protein n=1 Tax=Candidatus Avisuccinivibrio stercorigallinarum TaxID=2840704 RepID=A0A9D9D9M4_9GAMM|nr:hypothetical protein [Candidatus Avisuccinivibrio stercorigallinarum]
MLTDRSVPRFIGIGGALSALLAGLSGSFKELPKFFLCPLTFIAVIPAGLLLPPVYALFMYAAALRFKGQQCSLRALLSLHLSSVIVLELFYLAALFLLGAGADALINSYLQDYLAAAAAHQVVQIGTAEQLAYAKQVILTLQCSGGLWLLFTGFIFCVCACMALKLRAAAAAALGVFFKNLPAFLLLLLITVLAFTFLERSFADFKIEYLKGGALTGAYGFNWSWIFILVRLYLLQAVISALMLAAGAGAGLFKFNFSKTKD